MSKNSSNRKALNLLEKLVQEQGETTPEQQRLLDTLIMKNGGDKFYKKENGKYISKSAAGTNKQRSSRARTKVKKEKSNIQKRSELIVSQSEQQNHETHKISVPDAKENPSSRSSSRSSASSFWSHGQESKPKTRSRSKSRSRSRSRSDSRSRSYSDSRSRSRSRSSSGSRSSSRSRSRSGSRSGSSRSRSESRSRSGSSRSRSRSTEPSHSTVQSVPVKSNELHVRLNDRDTMSDIGIRKPPAGSRRRKLAKRGQIRKFRSLEINPDIFFEERLQQKYRELADIMKGSHLKTSTITRQHLGQMQKLREQYHMVSHGLAPPGVLVPRSLPSSVRNRNNSSGIGKKKRPMSGSSYNSEFSSFAADPAYGTLQDIMNGNSAQERHLLKPIRKTKKISKKKDKKHKGSNSTLDDVSFDLNKIGGSDSNAASTPRSVTKAEREDHHIKVSENPKLLQWLKEKDKMHRKKKREEKMKKREERDKMVLEANERFEKRLEAQKIYDKWLCEKNVEISKQKKYERKERKRIRSEREMNQKNEMTVRSKSASLNRRDKSGGVRVEGNSETNFNIKKEKDAVESQNGNASDHVTPHPPASKFIYKRPVAGRIKLRLSNSATGNRPERPKSANSSDQKNQENKTRMSYDQWILQKRKQDELKKDMEEKRRQEQLSKSDPDMNKLIPEIAKKRIHNVLEGKKRIDTGVQRIDEKLNKKFGGKDFNNDEGENSARESEEEKVRYSYRLESDEATKSSDKSSGKLNVSGKAIQRPPGSNRPQTAPAGGNRVPPPKHSSGSPRKAVVPAKVEEVMSNEDTSNPFKLPFPEDQGVPKHVASRQRKLFADRVWSNLEGEERPEPQGSDIPEPPLCVSSSAPQKDTNDSLDESGVSESNDINDEDAEESKEQGGRDEESKVFLTQFTSVENLANISKSEENEKEDLEINGKKTESENVQTETNTKEAEKTEENHINSVGDEGELKLDTDESDIGQKETQKKMNKDNGNDDLETDGLGEKSEEKATENIKETLNADDDNLRPESANTSRSKKSVSFCEDPEVFGLEQEEQEWSTDTQTPEEDNAMYMSSGDRYSREPDDTDMIRTNDSLDDDF